MPKKNTYSITTNNGTHNIRVKNDSQDFNIEYEGDITISDDDRDIVAISRGGFIEIKKSRFGKRRRLVIESEGGKLIRKFFIGWSEKPYDPDGKNWLADILPDIVRSTTIGAQSRVDRFYKRGGANAVMSEIGKIKMLFDLF